MASGVKVGHRDLGLRHGVLWIGAVFVACVALCACVPTSQTKTVGGGGDTQLSTGQKGASSTQAPVSGKQEAMSQAISAIPSDLQNEDCEKCHDEEPAAIEENGGKHKTLVTCMECHLEHLPLGTQTIPECSMCHGGGGHFELENCLSCHRNPHTPLVLDVEDTPAVGAACVSCHEEKGEEFKKHPSKHAKQNCTRCHPKQHKTIIQCDKCHKPHGEFMAYKDCQRCHKPHSPLEVTYADDIPANYCGACHSELYERLQKNRSKHRNLTCAFCHKSRHPMVPKCQDCHEAPHSSDLLAGFPDCLTCHSNPHDLVI